MCWPLANISPLRPPRLPLLALWLVNCPLFPGERARGSWRHGQNHGKPSGGPRGLQEMLEGEGSSRVAEQERVKELSRSVCAVGFPRMRSWQGQPICSSEQMGRFASRPCPQGNAVHWQDRPPSSVTDRLLSHMTHSCMVALHVCSLPSSADPAKGFGVSC